VVLAALITVATELNSRNFIHLIAYED